MGGIGLINLLDSNIYIHQEKWIAVNSTPRNVMVKYGQE